MSKIAGIAGGSLLVGMAGLVLMVSLFSVQLSGSGGGGTCPTPLPTQNATVSVSMPSSSTVSPTQATGLCYPAPGAGVAVAQAALSISRHLSGDPDVWYDAGMPQPVLQYWQSTCPPGSGCWVDWQEGNLQCVLLVTGTYALAGSPLPAAGNAIDFWSLYQNRPGWMEIPSAVAPPSQRGLPMPGDIMVWYDPPPRVGHVAIVVGVNPPINGQNGSVTFAEANGPGALVTQTLLPDLSVITWSSPIPYTVLGYIRPASGIPNSPYVLMAWQDAANVGIDPQVFVQQINVESGFNPNALSSVGAEGIAQFLPSTAQSLGVDPWDPMAALQAAAQLMASYLQNYGGDYAKALAAYNAGSGTLHIAINTCRVNWLSCMPVETQHYIQAILGI
jgi:Transglycosylase SLT domain/CHAP domain